MFHTNKKCKTLKECYLLSNILKRDLASSFNIYKQLINPDGGLPDVTTIMCVSSRFRVLYLLSWEFVQSEIL